jgi:hypothetical protein
MDDVTVEAIVAELSRASLTEDVVVELDAKLRTAPDWNALLTIAANWDLEPVVLSNLRRYFASAIPSALSSKIEARAREVRALAVGRSLVAAAIASDLERAAIQVIVLKGPAVSLHVYGDIALRSYSDIDLLVTRRDLTRSRDFLLQRGYRRDYDSTIEHQLVRDGHALEFSNGRDKVELHTTLFPRHLRFALPTQDLMRESVVVPMDNHHIRTLSKRHLALYLCAHAAKHRWAQVRWVADIAWLLEQFSAQEAEDLIILSKKTHTQRLLALSLARVQSRFGIAVPSFQAALGVRGTDAAIMARPIERIIMRFSYLHPQLPALSQWLVCRERSVDIVASIVTLLFAPTRHDAGPAYLRPIIRPLRLGIQFMRGSLDKKQ